MILTIDEEKNKYIFYGHFNDNFLIGNNKFESVKHFTKFGSENNDQNEVNAERQKIILVSNVRFF